MPVSRGSEIKVGLFTLIALGAFLAAVLVLTVLIRPFNLALVDADG